MRRLLVMFALIPPLMITVACAKRPAADPAYLADLERWRAHRLAALTSETGWLTLVGLHWLAAGDNSFGSDPGNAIVLTGPGVPARTGIFGVGDDHAVVLRAELGSGVMVNGAAPTAAPLASDRTGKPDLIAVGRLRITVIARGDRLALRVRDPENQARTAFRGIESFPVDPRLVVSGRFERYLTPREVEVATAQGPAQRMLVPGIVRFSFDGQDLALEPFVFDPADRTLFFVFRDSTAGLTTYGAGRFLYADAPAAGATTVTLDFNRATNPPCAFTRYATCPLPPPQNVLPVDIEAGEKAPSVH